MGKKITREVRFEYLESRAQWQAKFMVNEREAFQKFLTNLEVEGLEEYLPESEQGAVSAYDLWEALEMGDLWFDTDDGGETNFELILSDLMKEEA